MPSFAPRTRVEVYLPVRYEASYQDTLAWLKACHGAEVLRAQQLLGRTQELLEQIVVVPFDPAAAAEFHRLRPSRSLRKIGRADLLIASIALANDAR